MLEDLVVTDIQTVLIPLEASRRIRQRQDYNDGDIYEASKLFFVSLLE